METRLSKREKKNAKRMATVAAVYTIDAFQRTPQDMVPDNRNDEYYDYWKLLSGDIAKEPHPPNWKQKEKYESSDMQNHLSSICN